MLFEGLREKYLVERLAHPKNIWYRLCSLLALACALAIAGVVRLYGFCRRLRFRLLKPSRK